MTLYRCYKGPPPEGTRRAECGCHFVNDITLIHYWGCLTMEAHRKALWEAQQPESRLETEPRNVPPLDDHDRQSRSAHLGAGEEWLSTDEWSDEDQADFEAEWVAEWVDEHGYHPDQLCERCGIRPIAQVMPYLFPEPPKGSLPDDKRDRVLYCRECTDDHLSREEWPF